MSCSSSWGQITETGEFISDSDNHLSGCFGFLPQTFGKVEVTYECYFRILWMQIEWWGHSETVRTLKPYLL